MPAVTSDVVMPFAIIDTGFAVSISFTAVPESYMVTATVPCERLSVVDVTVATPV